MLGTRHFETIQISGHETNTNRDEWKVVETENITRDLLVTACRPSNLHSKISTLVQLYKMDYWGAHTQLRTILDFLQDFSNVRLKTFLIVVTFLHQGTQKLPSPWFHNRRTSPSGREETNLCRHENSWRHGGHASRARSGKIRNHNAEYTKIDSSLIIAYIYYTTHFWDKWCSIEVKTKHEKDVR